MKNLCQFPHSSAHQNQHTGQAVATSEPLDNRAVEYLKKQIQGGYPSLNVIFF